MIKTHRSTLQGLNNNLSRRTATTTRFSTGE